MYFEIIVSFHISFHSITESFSTNPGIFVIQCTYIYLNVCYSSEMSKLSLESAARTQLDVFKKDRTTKDEQMRKL